MRIFLVGCGRLAMHRLDIQATERTLIDIQELSTSTIGSYLNAYFVNGGFAATSDLEGSYVEETPPETVGTLASLYGWTISGSNKSHLARQPPDPTRQMG
jgi:hypothetical protein